MKSSYLTQFATNACALFGVWLVLSGRYDVPHLIIGGLVACGVAWLNTGFHHSPFHHFPLGRLLLYSPWLLARIVESSIHVTKVILSPSLPIEPRLFHYQTHLKHQLAIVLLGNSITLTPGTITVEVEGNHLMVHAIDEASHEDLVSGRMERKMASVFREDVSAE